MKNDKVSFENLDSNLFEKLASEQMNHLIGGLAAPTTVVYRTVGGGSPPTSHLDSTEISDSDPGPVVA